jgi:hypothetical protein
MVVSAITMTPWPPSAVAVIVTSLRVSEEPVPLAKPPLAPQPVVEMEPPVMVIVLERWSTSRDLFRFDVHLRSGPLIFRAGKGRWSSDCHM